MNWHYRVKAPAEKVRDPIQGEFFSTEAIKNPADALVREALKNAVDAALRDRDGQPKDMLRVWKDGFESGRPVFIREGLIISDVRAGTAATRGSERIRTAKKGR